MNNIPNFDRKPCRTEPIILEKCSCRIFKESNGNYQISIELKIDDIRLEGVPIFTWIPYDGIGNYKVTIQTLIDAINFSYKCYLNSNTPKSLYIAEILRLIIQRLESNVYTQEKSNIVDTMQSTLDNFINEVLIPFSENKRKENYQFN